MIKKLILVCAVLCWFAGWAFAQLVEEETPIVDNQAALGTGDNSADILGNSEEQVVMGTKEGEITLRTTEAAVEVFSGFNKVESIPRQSDGWVGSFTFESSLVKFHPAGRPELECPAQALSGWFGPCKIAKAQE